MHFYMQLINLFPFIILQPTGDMPPVGESFVVDYQHRQVVIFDGSEVIAKD